MRFDKGEIRARQISERVVAQQIGATNFQEGFPPAQRAKAEAAADMTPNGPSPDRTLNADALRVCRMQDIRREIEKKLSRAFGVSRFAGVIDAMPRFFFTVSDGETVSLPDKDGLELRDKRAAWEEATSACGEMIKDLDGSLKPGQKWTMRVTDHLGGDIFELEFRSKEFLA